MKDALLAQVYAQPDSDEPRMVLADLLMEEGDPRGEFIAKQLAGEHAAAEPLLAQHGAEWLGSLRRFTQRVQFQRGFPTRLELAQVSFRPDIDRLAADPAVGTIEDLLVGEAPDQVYNRLIASSAMTALRRVAITDPEMLSGLRKSPAKIVHVGHAVWRYGVWPGTDPDSLRDFLTICERRSDVTSLAFNADSLDLVLASPIAPRLTAVAVRGHLPEIGSLTQRLPRHIAMTIVPHSELEDCAPGPARWIGGVELVSSRVLRAWGHWGHYRLRQYLELLPAQVERIELCGRPEHFDEFERAARNRRFELAVLRERPRHGYIDLRRGGG